MTTNKYAKLVVVFVLALGQLGVSATPNQANKGVFAPSKEYLELQKRLESETMSEQSTTDILRSLLKELDDAAGSNLDLGEYEAERRYIVDLMGIAKPEADRCDDDLTANDFIEGRFTEFRKSTPFKIDTPTILSYMMACMKRQKELCTNLKKDLAQQKEELMMNKKLEGALKVLNLDGKLDFARTFNAVDGVVSVLDSAKEKYGGRLSPEYVEIREKYWPLYDIFQLDKKKCGHIFGTIEELRQKHPNMGPYFDHVYKLQKGCCRE